MSPLDVVTCPKCNDHEDTHCAECGDEWFDCSCETWGTQQNLACLRCITTWQASDDDFIAAYLFHIGEDEEAEDVGPPLEHPTDTCFCTSAQAKDCPFDKYCSDNKLAYAGYDDDMVAGAINTTGATSTTLWVKCRHYDVEYTLANGKKVWPSSKRTTYPYDIAEMPDFGLYADYSWRPLWHNSFINWPDFSTPVHDQMAYEQIKYAYSMVEKDLKVECGCIGGHGRTGTILACMEVLAGMDPEAAVKRVRETYCKEAIESEEQEWWVKKFKELHDPNYTAPAKPVFTTTFKATTTSATRDGFVNKSDLEGDVFVGPKKYCKSANCKEPFAEGEKMYPWFNGYYCDAHVPDQTKPYFVRGEVKEEAKGFISGSTKHLDKQIKDGVYYGSPRRCVLFNCSLRFKVGDVMYRSKWSNSFFCDEHKQNDSEPVIYGGSE